MSDSDDDCDSDCGCNDTNKLYQAIFDGEEDNLATSSYLKRKWIRKYAVTQLVES